MIDDKTLPKGATTVAEADPITSLPDKVTEKRRKNGAAPKQRQRVYYPVDTEPGYSDTPGRPFFTQVKPRSFSADIEGAPSGVRSTILHDIDDASGGSSADETSDLSGQVLKGAQDLGKRIQDIPAKVTRPQEPKSDDMTNPPTPQDVDEKTEWQSTASTASAQTDKSHNNSQENVAGASTRDPYAYAEISPEDKEKRIRESVIGLEEQRNKLLEEAKKRKPESEEHRKNRERRNRSKKFIATLSDGLSALSNLWFTHQYAPNRQTAPTRARELSETLEKARTARDKRDQEYLEYSLRADKLKEEIAKRKEDTAERVDKHNIAVRESNNKAEAHQWAKELQKSKRKKADEDAKKAEADRKRADIIANNEEERQRAHINYIKKRTQYVGVSKKSSGGGGRKKGRGGGGYSVETTTKRTNKDGSTTTVKIKETGKGATSSQKKKTGLAGKWK